MNIINRMSNSAGRRMKHISRYMHKEKEMARRTKSNSKSRNWREHRISDTEYSHIRVGYKPWAQIDHF